MRLNVMIKSKGHEIMERPGSVGRSLLQAVMLPVLNPRRIRQDDLWRNAVSHVFITFLMIVGLPLMLFGKILEWLLNFYYLNGGSLSQIFFKLLLEWRIRLPVQGTPDYYSLIGYLDPRFDLSDPNAGRFFKFNSKECAELCIMSAKLAYKSEAVQRKVLERQWDMCFYKFYNCRNARTGRRRTQAFMFTDRPKGAKLVVLAFRGTKPFDTRDWCTDIDFGWYRPPGDVGAIHMGFLEALGLQNRKDPKALNVYKSNNRGGDETAELPRGGFAYDEISKDLGNLMLNNPNAKLIVTGHSLGGALAVLFAGMLLDFNSSASDEGAQRVLQSLKAIYTLGQPRVGDPVFADHLTRIFEQHGVEYHRVVYGYDLVTRVPFSDKIFRFMHAGRMCNYFMCNYFHSSYTEKGLREEPDANFFDVRFFITSRIKALLELCNALFGFTRRIEGDWYKESTLMLMARISGLFLPGLTDHCPTNYVNAIRLGPENLCTILKN